MVLWKKCQLWLFEIKLFAAAEKLLIDFTLARRLAALLGQNVSAAALTAAGFWRLLYLTGSVESLMSSNQQYELGSFACDLIKILCVLTSRMRQTFPSILCKFAKKNWKNKFNTEKDVRKTFFLLNSNTIEVSYFLLQYF